MYAIVVGAGEVGFHIAAILSQEGQEVAIIDRDRELCDRASQELDVLAIRGNGASRRILEQASMGRADLLIAVTDSDEVNMIACMAAKRVGVGLTVARVRNADYIEDVRTLSTGFTGVDQVIQPEAAVADEVVKLARFPGALDVESFAAGQVSVVEVPLSPESADVGVPLRSLGLPERVIVTAVLRAGETFVPRGESILCAGDRVFLTGSPEAVMEAAARFSGRRGALKRAILLGCGEIGLHIAQSLEHARIRLTVFEKDREQAAFAAAHLRRAMVIRDEGIDETVLLREGVAVSDLFVAATGDDRLNILAALMAKQLGAQRTIAIVERSEFSRVVESVGVDVAISPRRMTASAILRYVRAGRVVSAAVLDKSAGEVLEFVVGRSSPVCDRPLADVNFPPGAVVGAVVSGDEVRIPDGRTVLRDSDVAIVFTIPGSVRLVEKLFAFPGKK